MYIYGDVHVTRALFIFCCCRKEWLEKSIDQWTRVTRPNIKKNNNSWWSIRLFSSHVKFCVTALMRVSEHRLIRFNYIKCCACRCCISGFKFVRTCAETYSQSTCTKATSFLVVVHPTDKLVMDEVILCYTLSFFVWNTRKFILKLFWQIEKPAFTTLHAGNLVLNPTLARLITVHVMQ